MWEIIKKWFADLGEFLFKFSKTAAAGFVKKYGPIALNIVAKVATTPGLSGAEKFALAGQMLLVEIPGAAQYLIDTAIQTAYAIWKEEQLAKEKIDTDGDGVPDYKDLCADMGIPEGGCVTAEGCPDSDCDGVADKFDPCPTDPNCK